MACLEGNFRGTLACSKRSMWRRSKQSIDTTSSSEVTTSERPSPSHRLAKALLRPFSRRPRPEELPQRTKSDTHLTFPNAERKLRLSKSSLDSPKETRAAENMERAPKVEVREVRKLSSPPPVGSAIEEVGTVSKAVAAAPVMSVVKPKVALPSEAEGLPEDVVNDLIAAFKYFDHNSDGCIDKEELGAVMRSLGDNPTDAELTAMITAVDQNGDGSICLGEFLNLNKMALEAGLAGDEDTELRATFDVFDLDKNGFISCEELQQVLSRLLGEPVVEAECSRMIQGVDQDGDGQVNFQEFHTMMQQVMPC
ncbi:calmodulin [Klebsormidium nitens]|uniref:Calmodulin n=1 Tax=Klebsormidium nitens TaxID=105231 RepID=A0A1Y1IIJ4_KLENI|nr:calmodulin [Klebsormidium nitens]|eukprot:GAQ88477.1 calmodulin [Klebsormidium nitens]